jgi:serine/threonine protein phosphatase PrpC
LAYNDLRSLGGTEAQLVELVLSGNRNLGSIPPLVGTCAELHTLLMADCGLSGDPDSVRRLLNPANESNLEVLDLSGNGLAEIPEIQNMPFLRRLDLSHNKLKTLTCKTTLSCKELELLDLGGNRFQVDPEELEKVSASLETLADGPETESDDEESGDEDCEQSTVQKLLSYSKASKSLPKFSLSDSLRLVPEDEEKAGSKEEDTKEEDANEDDDADAGRSPLEKHLRKHHLMTHLHVDNVHCDDSDSPLVFGHGDMWGRRPSMEDASSFYAPAESPLPNSMLFSMFDGHAGSSVAKYAGQHVGTVFDDLMLSITTKQPTTAPRELLPSVMRQLLPRLNEHLYYWSIEQATAEPELSEAGATALSVHVSFDKFEKRGRAVCANLGDTRCVLSRHSVALRLSVDHKPDMDEDRVRVLGGYVAGEDTRRVNGDLAMSRCLGDFGMRPHVFAGTQDVFVSVTNLSEVDEFIIVGCDGVWDVLTDQQAVDVVREALSDCVSAEPHTRCCTASRALRDAAYATHSDDNISTLVVLLGDVKP